MYNFRFCCAIVDWAGPTKQIIQMTLTVNPSILCKLTKVTALQYRSKKLYLVHASYPSPLQKLFNQCSVFDTGIGGSGELFVI